MVGEQIGDGVKDGAEDADRNDEAPTLAVADAALAAYSAAWLPETRATSTTAPSARRADTT